MEVAVGEKGMDMWLLLMKGHLRVLVPPEVDAATLRGDFTAGHPGPDSEGLASFFLEAS